MEAKSQLSSAERVTQYMKKTELAKAKEFDLLNREDYIQRLLEKRKAKTSTATVHGPIINWVGMVENDEEAEEVKPLEDKAKEDESQEEGSDKGKPRPNAASARRRPLYR